MEAKTRVCSKLRIVRFFCFVHDANALEYACNAFCFLYWQICKATRAGFAVCCIHFRLCALNSAFWHTFATKHYFSYLPSCECPMYKTQYRLSYTRLRKRSVIIFSTNRNCAKMIISMFNSCVNFAFPHCHKGQCPCLPIDTALFVQCRLLGYYFKGGMTLAGLGVPLRRWLCCEWR
jgi:hypothetical protein